MSRRAHTRDQRGATTAEYVGILVFVAMLVSGVVVLTTDAATGAKDTIHSALCRIGGVVGASSGCTGADKPYYQADTCTVSSNGQEWGGSVSVVATAGGDTGYTILKIQEVQPDGTIKTSYVVKTKGKGNVSWSPGAKGGVEASGGDSGVKAKAGVKLTINGEVETGQTFSFDSLEDAQKFADDNKAKFGGLIGKDGDVQPTSTYYQAGAGATGKGEVGPLSATGGIKAVVGVETTDSGPRAGDTKYKVIITPSLAAELGIPLPTEFVNATAKGDASLAIEANITFDKDGNITTVQGKADLTVKGGAQVALGPSSSQQKDAGATSTVKLPNINLQGGGKASYAFTTDFSNAANNQALTQGFTDMINGEGVTPEFQQAVQTQFMDHSQQTFTVASYNENKSEYGIKVSTPIGDFGAEGHHVETNENTQGGWYYNPYTGEWQENLACAH